MLEWIGVITGVGYVILAAHESLLCWPVGLVNLSVYFYVFWQSRLYADASLQLLYLVLTVYGFLHWRRSAADPSRVVRLGKRSGALAVLACLVLNAALFLILKQTNSDVAFLDSHTTAVSVIAQALTGRRVLENWWFWIWANIVYCGLYVYKGLYPTTGLYFLFIVLAVYGYTKWKRNSLLK